ncbi:hypothetical protein DL95DRAFT_415165 [Leptodontidium sp. 2 PMI_412]|nr:hypothetical protein DL95DRAFT_415165 [Leptodontidium sp. 2 PMI_412]
MPLIKDGTAVITCASSGIGRATAIQFALGGCKNIALGDLSLSGLEETRNFILQKSPDAVVEISKFDVTDEALVDQFYSNVATKFGGIHYAANVAGAMHSATPVHESTSEMYDKVFAVNQKGPAGRNFVQRHGGILDALDYGPEGTRVNTVAPGPTTTPLLVATQNDQFIRKMETLTPLQRNARSEDIANALVRLSSERAFFITGVSLVVDGGLGLESGI